MTEQREAPGTVVDVSRSIVLGLLAEAAVIGGGLYYFGYVRTRSAYAYFGIDPSLVRLGTQDYVLRSVNSVGIPLLVCVLVYLAVQIAVAAAPQLKPGWFTEHRSGTLVPLSIAGALGTLGLAGLAIGRLSGRDQVGIVSAVLLTLAFLLAGGGVRQLSRSANAPAGLDRIAAATYATAAIMIFVAVTGFAASTGRKDAERIAEHLPDRPAVTVRSEDRLDIHGFGAEEIKSTAPDTHYPYRYDDLRLLAVTGGQYILLPPQWRPGAPVFIVPSKDGLRMDVVAERPLL
ncbi:hypothetical protein AB0C07_28910 [Actinoplanes missouriensis]|uniref:hypothetical protein n=1 Tax=Actinoplanes missouriensis TaxID=1866 RepID=UPI003411A5EC